MALCVRLKIATRPSGATWLQTDAVCVLCGIGFTMSLLIGPLAFYQTPEFVEEAKLGVLLGSLLSAVLGFAMLRAAPMHESCAPGRKALPQAED